MSEKRRIGALMIVAVVLLAGCSAGLDGGPTPGGDTPSETVVTPGAGTGGETGTLAFYVSDRPTAIGDFASLTVTVTEIGVHRVGANDETEEEGTGNATPREEDANQTTSDVTGPNAATTRGSKNKSGSPDATEVSTDSADGADTESGDGDGEDDPDGNESDDGSGWITHAVDDATVDLTELQGTNATRIANVSLSAGEYNGVYLEVSNVTGTLTTGATASVKLPSDRLRLNKGFVLGAGGTTSKTNDVGVHEAGGSGKYVLRPVIGESGADVPIQDVTEKNPEE